MAALLYLPRLFVYHRGLDRDDAKSHATFCRMESRLLRIIANPAMIATWLFGLTLVGTPGLIDWSMGWPWAKFVAVLGMTVFHAWAARTRRRLEQGICRASERRLRLMNEIPAVLVLLIVIVVVVKPF